MTGIELIVVVVVVVLVLGGLLAGLLIPRRQRARPPEQDQPPAVEQQEDSTLQQDADRPATGGATAPPTTDESTTDESTTDESTTDESTPDTSTTDEPAAPTVETPEPAQGRLVRLRSRLARSQSTLGSGLLAVLSRDRLDEDAWEEVEDTLLTADVGVGATTEIVERLRERVKVLGTRTPEDLRTLLTEELLTAVGTDADRTVHSFPHADSPAVVLVVGVNGTGKTTTCGKLARVLVADGRSVVLGAADTFRAAAADQLQTWGSRVGAQTVRGAEGADPASIAFEAVKQGAAAHVDTVLIDTAGRLHTKAGLMDELGKVKRVVERHGPVDETLLVLDATTGQNGLIQARAFTDIVDITGVVLTKLDGSAKGGIVIAVQRELGVPVKLIGLGEGADDLAPFEPAAFVDALVGQD